MAKPVTPPLPDCLTQHGITELHDNLGGAVVQLKPGILSQFLGREFYAYALKKQLVENPQPKPKQRRMLCKHVAGAPSNS